MSKLAVFLADGFEEIEGLTVVDLCRRAGFDVRMVSISAKKEVTGAHNIIVMADELISETAFDTFDMLVLPGGGVGTKNLEACETLMVHVEEFYKQGKAIGAICAAPSIFGHKGWLKGRNACSYPGFESHLEGAQVSQNQVEVSENVITSRGLGTSIPFALAIIERFCGKEKAQEIATSVVYC